MEKNTRVKDITLTYEGCDSWGRPVYKDQNGRYWKDVDLGGRPTQNGICSADSFDGEPYASVHYYTAIRSVSIQGGPDSGAKFQIK
ncbi:MAG: hypothetical protein IJD91_08050 [Clostridia bacterium]|nr:hypothetical protein [Clostridia bacterium]